jgi:hypothetical protein
MAATLHESLLAQDTRPKVLSDCLRLIAQELADKSGVTGNAIKLAYKTVSSFAPGYLRQTMDDMLPQIVDKLQPFWTDFTAAGGSEFGDYLAKRGQEVSETLLSISDAMGEVSEHPTIVRAYRAVRGSAAKHVEAALPRIGDLVFKYAA